MTGILGGLRILRSGDWAVVVCVALAAVLVAIVGFVIFDSARARQDDVRRSENQAAQAIDSRAAASRRIDVMQQRIGDLTEQIAAGRYRQGELEEQVAVLAEQVRRLGGRPVVAATPRPTG